MPNGTFIYQDRRGRTVRAPVRDCPDPAKARSMLEENMMVPVRWEPAR